MKKPRGFTMIELLIVITIIAVMTSIAVTTFSSTTKKAEFTQQIDQFVAHIREARSLAINSKTVDHNGEQKPPKSYAIKFQRSGTRLLYTFYADKNEPLNPENHYHLNAFDLILGEFKLPDDIAFSVQIEKTSGGKAPWNQDFDLFYEPPFADFMPDPTLNTFRNLLLKLTGECDGCSKDLILNLKTGLLEEVQ